MHQAILVSGIRPRTVHRFTVSEDDGERDSLRARLGEPPVRTPLTYAVGVARHRRDFVTLVGCGVPLAGYRRA